MRTINAKLCGTGSFQRKFLKQKFVIRKTDLWYGMESILLLPGSLTSIRTLVNSLLGNIGASVTLSQHFYKFTFR